MHPLRALGAALVLAGSLVAVTSALGVATSVGAAPGPPPPFVTDYANYPGNAGVPAGCDALRGDRRDVLAERRPPRSGAWATPPGAGGRQHGDDVVDGCGARVRSARRSCW